MSEVKSFRADLCVHPVMVVLASDYDSLAAECEMLRLRRDQYKNSYDPIAAECAELRAERDAALAELAALKGGREAVAHRKTWSPGVTGFSCLHFGKARAYHDMQTFCPTGPSFASGSFGAAPIAPPAQASAWVPEGWKSAPLEPTPAMIDVAVSHALMVSLSSEYNWSAYMRDVWLRMLAAAPTPGASDGKGGAN